MKTVKMWVMADNPQCHLIRRPIVLTPSRCMTCAHLHPSLYVRQCEAFPEGIPEAVWEGEHTQPVDGDHGIQYRRRNIGEPFVKLADPTMVQIDVQVEHD